MAKTKQELNQYIEKWQRENIKRVVVKLNKKTDADIIQQLEGQDSVQGYIKQLIRDDMK